MKIARMATTIISTFAFGQFTGKALYTEIEIDAPKEIVWQHLTDTGSHASWNPFIRRFEGELTVGRQLSVTIQPPGGSAMDFSPYVLKADQNKELRWIGRLGFRGVFDGEHYFIVEDRPDGKTLFRHGETFSGVLAYVLFGFLEDTTRNGFKAMNAALKQRAEAKA